MSAKRALRVMLGTFTDWFVDVFRLQRWPDDSEKRKRMMAFILGAGSGGRASGKIEVEDAKSGNLKVQSGTGK